MIKLVDLERNDLPGSLAYYLQCQTDGRWSPDKAQSVASLHDDPEMFLLAVFATGDVAKFDIDQPRANDGKWTSGGGGGGGGSSTSGGTATEGSGGATAEPQGAI